MSKYITFVTGNAKKLEEFFDILGPNFSQKIKNRWIDLPEYQGKISEICVKKCKTAAKIIQGPVLVEDTSLCFDALNGMPGPYIKWFMNNNVGPDGLCRMLMGFDNKKAQAICTYAYSSGNSNDSIMLFQGTAHGKIVQPRGSWDFDWDPCFQPDELDSTYAELTKKEKNQISHRYKALQKLKEHLIKVID